MQEESEHLAEVKNLSSTDKGEWLEVKIKEAMEAEGFTVTITKVQRWNKNKREMQIIGENGVDGITRIRINEHQYNGIIQCKCYAATTRISTDVIAQIDNNLDHWKMERSFGILVMLTKGSLNQRAINAIKNARNPIIAITLHEIMQGELKQKILEIKWENYPGKQLKRTRIELEEAEEIKSIGEFRIEGKKIKGLVFEENLIQY